MKRFVSVALSVVAIFGVLNPEVWADTTPFGNVTTLVNTADGFYLALSDGLVLCSENSGFHSTHAYVAEGTFSTSEKVYDFTEEDVARFHAQVLSAKLSGSTLRLYTVPATLNGKTVCLARSIESP